nr:Chain A, Transthyretin [Rattus norvegicus]2M5K_A Chain A, Transthyretin [Rattus norvegicus]2M5K_B Chain B, Transthyretin [Rattus norvegicus]2M5K_C Chain C, Transthyretin [Rattus norvegicus]2M5K_D Chain D, Transthyretin [Rattus norvegicus]2M5K_E Chain E, Transthyretin [Rattus norvegicus]2M5K_F Chain F, Transthyretin [Rattus norvegicus]2M5K_G Chain G, Transthyretin [Rattus norvegicus]2M5K_H Chain H, Transthyretin [Rattus norvegicus]2M5M_A Chain A, Transthyretin [Rattus norvegicus]2M5M_B 
YTIAALLSPYS